MRWCHQHLGEDASVSITRNKDNSYGKFLYDDYPPYAEAWLENRPRGVAIMPTNRHNVLFTHPQVFKWDKEDKWLLERVMLAIFNRAPNESIDLAAILH